MLPKADIDVRFNRAKTTDDISRRPWLHLEDEQKLVVEEVTQVPSSVEKDTFIETFMSKNATRSNSAMNEHTRLISPRDILKAANPVAKDEKLVKSSSAGKLLH